MSSSFVDEAPVVGAHVGQLSAFRDAYASVIADLEGALQVSCQMTLIDFDVLSALEAAAGRRLRMADLASTVHLSPAGLTRRLDVLSARGWVCRESCEHDRRGVFAVLSDAGAGRFAEAVPVYTAAEHEFCSHVVTGADASSFGRVLGRATAEQSQRLPRRKLSQM